VSLFFLALASAYFDQYMLREELRCPMASELADFYSIVPSFFSSLAFVGTFLLYYT